MKRFSPSERQAWLKGLPACPGSGALLLEDSEGKILIVKASYKDYWTLPSGIIEHQESPIEAAVRETKEEVGITVNPSEVSLFKIVFRRSDFICTYKFIFKAFLSEEMKTSFALQTDELSEYAFVSKEDILKADREYTSEITKWAQDNSEIYTEEELIIENET